VIADNTVIPPETVVPPFTIMAGSPGIYLHLFIYLFILGLSFSSLEIAYFAGIYLPMGKNFDSPFRCLFSALFVDKRLSESYTD